MEWTALLSCSRIGENKLSSRNGSDGELGRSHFFKDYDRIIFPSPFRRLGKKTQVHLLASNDHIHTRLTHSLEVASVGRSLGMIVGEKMKEQGILPTNVTPSLIGLVLQAACLAHDIGNPPFGHAGEEAIKSWFLQPRLEGLFQDLDDHERFDLLHFEGNAQGFRVVTQLEYNPLEGGMRLTYATLATMLKYPWTSREITRTSKYSCFRSEEHILADVANQVGLVEEADLKWCRHPLAFLAEAADDICYRILDLEDAHEMRILPFGEILEILKPMCEGDKDYHKIISIYSGVVGGV